MMCGDLHLAGQGNKPILLIDNDVLVERRVSEVGLLNGWSKIGRRLMSGRAGLGPPPGSCADT